MTTDPMAAIRETFFLECEEQLALLEAGLLAIDGGAADPETVNAVFRAVHSIKGGAGAFELGDLVAFAHAFETALDDVRTGTLVASHEVVRVLLRAADVLADLVRAARVGGDADDAGVRAVADELRALAAGEAGAAPPAASAPAKAGEPSPETAAPAPQRDLVIRFAPTAELYASANEPLLILRELARLGEAEIVCDTSGLPTLEALEPEGGHLAWTIRLRAPVDEAAVRDVFAFVEGACLLDIRAEDEGALHDAEEASTPVPPAAPDEPPMPAPLPPAVGKPPAAAPAEPARREAAHATIRVDLERVDRLINLIGELVINQAMLTQRVTEAGLAGSSAVAMGLDELGQLTREIQESVMAIRAQPVKPLFQRMHRVVREVADATGKAVRLKTEGEATEIDKTVVERLADPLTHMIRNAIDHGLERPEQRAARGKVREGTVRLSAAHRSGRVVIEVADDGTGIDRERVRESAVRKGLVPAEAPLADGEIDNLIFLPGFSTASSVSSISGRGVGMDVVKRSIQALGGRISIASRPGEGSTFTMSLPLTLAVLDGMVVAVDGQTFVVPLTVIVETFRPRAVEIHGIGDTGRVVAIRDAFVPLVDVGRELGLRAMPASPESGVVILVETEGDARTALRVDAIQDQRQVVIKSLEANYGPVFGVAAATILGNGQVALILDVDALVARSRGDAAPPEILQPSPG
jgi:two-component system chemotaxis sensor kinase CheA